MEIRSLGSALSTALLPFNHSTIPTVEVPSVAGFDGLHPIIADKSVDPLRPSARFAASSPVAMGMLLPFHPVEFVSHANTPLLMLGVVMMAFGLPVAVKAIRQTVEHYREQKKLLTEAIQKERQLAAAKQVFFGNDPDNGLETAIGAYLLRAGDESIKAEVASVKSVYTKVKEKLFEEQGKNRTTIETNLEALKKLCESFDVTPPDDNFKGVNLENGLNAYREFFSGTVLRAAHLTDARALIEDCYSLLRKNILLKVEEEKLSVTILKGFSSLEDKLLADFQKGKTLTSRMDRQNEALAAVAKARGKTAERIDASEALIELSRTLIRRFRDVTNFATDAVIETDHTVVGAPKALTMSLDIPEVAPQENERIVIEVAADVVPQERE